MEIELIPEKDNVHRMLAIDIKSAVIKDLTFHLDFEIGKQRRKLFLLLDCGLL